MAIALQGTRYSGHHFSRLKSNRSKKRPGADPAYLKGKLGIVPTGNGCWIPPGPGLVGAGLWLGCRLTQIST